MIANCFLQTSLRMRKHTLFQGPGILQSLQNHSSSGALRRFTHFHVLQPLHKPPCPPQQSALQHGQCTSIEMLYMSFQECSLFSLGNLESLPFSLDVYEVCAAVAELSLYRHRRPEVVSKSHCKELPSYC